ncbi:hypothetical protein [Chryseobacterium hagamense]|uniref:Uncharacterized protein n=1 Tax=Chryseobacterium hagamense TaxID=395935 RepID=A0A511YN62_9FLAO|nr:hypothetical protein [Chryseobacterium hagamense]GEN76638.1 hypothetical protein CHA01nite_23780 [Chryseobacterium hagamense]
MKKKKRDFESRFWSGTRKHTAMGLLETFFQFNDLAPVKEALTVMMQCSVQKKMRITDHPAEVFQLHQSLRSLVRAGHLISTKAKKLMANAPSESRFSKFTGLLSNEEYQNPVLVFQKAFEVCSLNEFEYFLASAVYFSLGKARCGQEKKIILPYIQLMKMLEAAYLMTEHTLKKTRTG